MELYVTAGPNGAGKTTFARKFLPKYANCRNFVNADLIAAGMSPFSPETAAVRAGRLMLEEIRYFPDRRSSFAFETTLSGRSNLALIHKLRVDGYKIHLFFLMVSSVEVALSRIKERVLKGGHDVPEVVVRRRFDRSFAISCVHIATLPTPGTCWTTQARRRQRLPSKKARSSV